MLILVLVNIVASLDTTERFYILQTLHLFTHIKFCINFTNIFLLDNFTKKLKS